MSEPCMMQGGKTAQIAAEMKNYNLTLLGISETRLIQSGQCRLASDEQLLYSGHEEEKLCTYTRSGINTIQNSMGRNVRLGSTWAKDH